MERYWSCNQTDKIIWRKSQFYQFTVILLSFVSLYSHTWLEPFFWIPGNFVWVFTLGEEVVIMNMYILYVVLQWIPLRHLFWPRLRGNRTPVNMVLMLCNHFFSTSQSFIFESLSSFLDKPIQSKCFVVQSLFQDNQITPKIKIYKLGWTVKHN